MHSSLKSLESATSANLAKPASPGTRLLSIDALRGLVMIIMALDHVRDFFHADAMVFSPTDLSRTTPVLFFTRWITHYCLPVFMFAAGMGVYLYGRSRTRGQLSRFLWTRGLWFIVLELTVMRFAYNFNFSLRFLILLLILWIFGICMLAMAALVYVPMRWLAALSVAVMRAAQLPGWNPGAAVRLRGVGLEPAASAGRYSGGGQDGAGDIYVSAMDRRDGRGLLLWPGIPTGTRGAPPNHAETWPGDDDCLYRAAGVEPLWRSGAVDAPEVSVVYRALISQLHQISGIARLSADDAGACVAGAGLV